MTSYRDFIDHLKLEQFGGRVCFMVLLDLARRENQVKNCNTIAKEGDDSFDIMYRFDVCMHTAYSA